MEGVNFFKIYCNHVWNYHNEISLIINVWYIKKISILVYKTFSLKIKNLNPIKSTKHLQGTELFAMPTAGPQTSDL
jgi:hypothetical protein